MLRSSASLEVRFLTHDPKHPQQATRNKYSEPLEGYYLSPNPTGSKTLGLCSFTASRQEVTRCCQGVICPEEGTGGAKLQTRFYFIDSAAHFDPESTHTPNSTSWP